jgi:hypothetical protein
MEPLNGAMAIEENNVQHNSLEIPAYHREHHAEPKKLQHQNLSSTITCSDMDQPPTHQAAIQQTEQPQQGQTNPPGDSPQTLPIGSDADNPGTTSGLASPLTDPDDLDQEFMVFHGSNSISDAVTDLYAENILAKAYRTATKSLLGEKRFPNYFPEYVPQDGEDAGNYSLREAEFWTCGFFPGTLFSLYERMIRYPRSVRPSSMNPPTRDGLSIANIRMQFQYLCNIWSTPLHEMAGRTDTHDIGFIVMPALRLDWELSGSARSLSSIIKAAQSLAARYVPTSGAIRSWDLLLKKNLEITNQEQNMIVIIDSLCNLDLLYYAADHSADGQTLYDMATSHAKVLLRSHLREEKPMVSASDYYSGPWYSTCHVANIDPRTGELKARLTHQGYANDSTWARGQSWGILGYAQTYMSTKEDIFLKAACGLTEYFVYRLQTAPQCVIEGSRWVPLWDFDAPIEDPSNPLRDSSAGAIAANGILILSQALISLGQNDLASRYFNIAITIVRELLAFAQAPEKALFVRGNNYMLEVEDSTLQTFDGILKYGTANNNQYSKKRYANHGLVYGDYYLVEFGNRLLRMGLV